MGKEEFKLVVLAMIVSDLIDYQLEIDSLEDLKRHVCRQISIAEAAKKVAPYLLHSLVLDKINTCKEEMEDLINMYIKIYRG